MNFIKVKGYTFLVKKECHPNSVSNKQIIKEKYKSDLIVTNPNNGNFLFIEYVPDVEYATSSKLISNEDSK